MTASCTASISRYQRTGTQAPSRHRIELALPGERWCDVTHRRDKSSRLRKLLIDNSREWTINDAITENLDMRELLADYLIQLSTPDECDTAFNVLRSLTVCDPTVGSGAFLFAALEVLDPLYEAVLGRAAELHDKNGDSQIADCLVEARRHPSERYWMLKTLCLNNLYGVDLMDEAPEIAKLRLFLKLAAQIDDASLVEPLPDLDFNIKTGNLLVGIADEDDADRRLSEGRLDLGGEIGRIRDVAEQVGFAYDTFVSEQAADLGTLDHATAKQKLSAQLEAARSLADTLLHSLRLESTRNTFEEWCGLHQPFHWFVEFPSVWRNQGFDVILGNPPYIKTRNVGGYRWMGYKTQACPDLYAPCVERASLLLNPQGRVAMVVMHSLCFSRNYTPLRKHLIEQFNSVWVSSYSRSPGGLFSGSSDVRNSIFVGTSLDQPRGLNTTRCWRWNAAYRPTLFEGLEYTKPNDELLKFGAELRWPFADGYLVSNAFARMMTNQCPISGILTKDTSIRLGYKTTALHMLGIYEDAPPTIDPVTEQLVSTSSERSGWLCFASDTHRDIAFVALAGRWGFNWWLMFDDSFDVNRSVLAALPADVGRLDEISEDDSTLWASRQKLLSLATRLKAEMVEHLEWKSHAGLMVGKYNLLRCRHITDKTDLLLGELWGVEDAYEAAGNLRDRMVFGN